MTKTNKVLKIVSAKHIGGHRLILTFSDEKEQTVDFGHFLENSQHPEIRKFLDPRSFKTFTVENGELMWGDFDLIFPIMDLYENKIDQSKSMANIKGGS